jgi:hypothetical protein
MCILICKLKNSKETFAIGYNQVVGSWIAAKSSEHQIFGRSVTLLPLETESLVKGLGNINV